MMLNQLRYFQAVVRCGSFTEAAEAYFISQSAISQQVKALEQELGIQLLERKNRAFTLTPAGEHFYKKTLVLVADYDRVVQETLRIARGDQEELRIGYLKGYSSTAIQQAVAAFTEKYPEVAIHLLSGSHEDLYHALRDGHADIVMNDQRRAFSDEYVNRSLAYRDCRAEIAARNPIAVLESVTPEDLKNTPCILVASKGQQRTERAYYQEIFGFLGDFLFADSIDEARVMVVQQGGFMPIDDGAEHIGNTTVQIPLRRGDLPIRRHYCAFWKRDNDNCYVEDFAEFLKEAIVGITEE